MFSNDDPTLLLATTGAVSVPLGGGASGALETAVIAFTLVGQATMGPEYKPVDLTAAVQGQVAQTGLLQANDAGENEQHGDGGRAWKAAQNRIKDLEGQMLGLNKKEKKAMKNKIKRIRQDAEKKRSGQNYSNSYKR